MDNVSNAAVMSILRVDWFGSTNQNSHKFKVFMSTIAKGILKKSVDVAPSKPSNNVPKEIIVPLNTEVVKKSIDILISKAVKKVTVSVEPVDKKIEKTTKLGAKSETLQKQTSVTKTLEEPVKTEPRNTLHTEDKDETNEYLRKYVREMTKKEKERIPESSEESEDENDIRAVKDTNVVQKTPKRDLELVIHPLDIENTVYVLRLPASANESTLRTIFGKYGEIKEVKIPSRWEDGVECHKCLACITFTTKLAAISSLVENNSIILGRQVRVERSPLYREERLTKRECNLQKRERSTRAVFVGMLPDDVVHDDIESHFKKHGVIEEIVFGRQKQNGHLAAVIQYTTKDEAASALSEDGSTLGGSKIRVDKNREKMAPQEGIREKRDRSEDEHNSGSSKMRTDSSTSSHRGRGVISRGVTGGTISRGISRGTSSGLSRGTTSGRGHVISRGTTGGDSSGTSNRGVSHGTTSGRGQVISRGTTGGDRGISRGTSNRGVSRGTTSGRGHVISRGTTGSRGISRGTSNTIDQE